MLAHEVEESLVTRISSTTTYLTLIAATHRGRMVSGERDPLERSSNPARHDQGWPVPWRRSEASGSRGQMNPAPRRVVSAVLAVALALGCSENSPSAAPLPATPRHPPRAEIELTLPHSPPLPPTVRHIHVAGAYSETDGTGQMNEEFLARARGECRSAPLANPPASHVVRATLYDTGGRVLDERALEQGEIADALHFDRFFTGCVADRPEGRRLVVRRGDAVFLDARASPHRPVLRILFPTPETRLVDRTKPDVFRWSASDADGPYWERDAISRDGEHFEGRGGAGLRSGVANDFELRADRFPISSEDAAGPLWLESEVSDGFWSAIVVVGPFRIRDCAAPVGFPPTSDACRDQ